MALAKSWLSSNTRAASVIDVSCKYLCTASGPRSDRWLDIAGRVPTATTGKSCLSAEFRARWFSWANPAETMLAYAELATKANPNVDLWALAVSTDHGGSSMPGRGLAPHFEDCARALSPIAETAPTSALDDSHMHRLETLDRALYARLMGFGDGPPPDRSEAWRTTLASAQRALGREGAIRDIAVPPVIRQVIDVLSKGLPVPDDKWQALEAAYVDALMYPLGCGRTA
jgi:hypothetical protein